MPINMVFENADRDDAKHNEAELITLSAGLRTTILVMNLIEELRE